MTYENFPKRTMKPVVVTIGVTFCDKTICDICLLISPPGYVVVAVDIFCHRV
jgi:hypothetical protein